MAEADQAKQADQAETPERARPANVVQAIARVMEELPGIGKDERASQQQGGYAYRGIEAITRHAQQLAGRYGVVFVPRVLSHHVQDIVVQGKPWTDTSLEVEYDVVGPGWRPASGLDAGCGDLITVGPLFAIGRDNSDKGANKAMTQAYKYALLQVFMVGDGKDDADSGSPEADQAPQRGQHRQQAQPERPLWQVDGYESAEQAAAQVQALQEGVRALGDEGKARVGAWLTEHGAVWTADAAKEHGHPDWEGRGRLGIVNAEQAAQLAEVIGVLLQQAKADQPDQPQDEAPSGAGEPAQEGQGSGAAAKDGTAAEKRRRPRNPR